MNHIYNYFYKITNNINGKYYYGIHSTDNLDDKYMGSGIRINDAYKKYGKENFTKEILKYFDTREQVEQYEEQIVNEALANDPNCYNIVIGGKRGICEAFSGHHLSEEHKRKLKLKLSKKDEDLKQKRRIVSKDGVKKSVSIKDIETYFENGWKLGRENCSYRYTMKEYRGLQKEVKSIKEQEYVKKKELQEAEQQRIHDILLNIAKNKSINLCNFGWNGTIINLLMEQDVKVKSNVRRFIMRHCPEFFDLKKVYNKKISRCGSRGSSQGS